MTTELFGSPGSFTFNAPDGVTNVKVTIRGTGGGGSGQQAGSPMPGAGGGGGGGYLVAENIQVTPGEAVTVFNGLGGAGGVNTDGQNGEDSYFRNTLTACVVGARGGARASGDGGAGGYGVVNRYTTFSATGGRGGDCPGAFDTGGGGGGAAAGPSGNGANGVDSSGSTGGAGGVSEFTPASDGAPGGNSGQDGGFLAFPNGWPGGGGGGSGNGNIIFGKTGGYAWHATTTVEYQSNLRITGVSTISNISSITG